MSRKKLGNAPVAVMKGLLCHTSLGCLYLEECDLTEKAVRQIKPGDWPKLRQLCLNCNRLSGDPVAAMEGLLCLTSLKELSLADCYLNGMALSQINIGDWPHLEELKY